MRETVEEWHSFPAHLKRKSSPISSILSPIKQCTTKILLVGLCIYWSANSYPHKPPMYSAGTVQPPWCCGVSSEMHLAILWFTVQAEGIVRFDAPWTMPPVSNHANNRTVENTVVLLMLAHHCMWAGLHSIVRFVR